VEGKYPIKTKEMVWQKAENAYVLLDGKTNQNITVDPISFLVWMQCDGKTSLDQITEIFAIGGNHDIVKAAVKGVVEKLEASGLITWV
jgi:hypothetical protein